MPYHNPLNLQIITNLCSVLRQPSYPCIGFCLDSDGQLRGSYDAQRNIAYIDGGLSLDDILMKHLGSLTLAEKYTLSITLTSSLLQLSHTPWFGEESCSKADIIFLRAKNTRSSPKQALVDFQHPYLTREHKPNNTVIVRRQTAPGNDSSKLLALGVILLEIWNSQPIESLRKPEDLGPDNQPNEATNLLALRRWLNEGDRGEISMGVLSAIEYCSKCFMEPNASLQDESFAKTVQEHVLAPLVEEIELLFGPVVTG
jgi:hypothetical protein